MFCYCKPLPHIIALVTLYTLVLITIPFDCHNVVQAIQQPTTANTDHEYNKSVINATTATATTEQICSTRMLKNSSLCKPCTCDPVGSVSPNCDQLTRRCSCRPGYTGNKCDKCSYGFHNLTSSTSKIASLDRWQCNTCGPCFDSWQERLTPLKEQAIALIKRASDLDRMFLNHLGLDPMNSKLVLNSSGASLLDTLDSSIRIIGEKILENKQASDQFNLLSSELNTTMISINEIDSEVANQTLECKKLDTKLESLNYDMLLHSYTQQDLTKSLEGYREELLDIQEFIPEGAIRLIKGNRNRTRKALASILEHDQKYSPILNGSLTNLEQMLDKVKYSKRQMKLIGSQILKDTLRIHPLAATDSHHELINHHYHSSLQAAHQNLDGPARLIAELDMQLFDNYLANFDNRTSEMSETRKQIEDAKGALLQAGNLMTAFETNLTSIDQVVSSLDRTSGCNFEQLVENATQIVRASLDKIDVKWPAAQTELADLTSNTRFVTKQQFSNLTGELNSALSENLSNLVAFKQQASQDSHNISNVKSLKNRTKLLADDLEDLSRKLNKLAELKHVTLDLHNRTKLLNTNIASEQDTMTADLANDINSVLARPNTLLADSKSALERVRDYQSASFGRKLTSDWMLATQIDMLTNSTAENVKLSKQVSDKVAELSSGLLIVNGLANTTSVADIKNSTRLSKLHDKRRLTNIVNDLRHISMLIHKGLMQSQNLSAEFDNYERTFASQTENN